MTTIVPSVHLTDFSCPYCGAHAAQTWYDLYGRENFSDRRRPFVPSSREDINVSDDLDPNTIPLVYEWVDRVISKEIFFEKKTENAYAHGLNNVFISGCFNCKKKALWHHEELVYPRMRYGAAPNLDLNQDIRDDIDEARSILDISPRGAAALLRLALQKLCKQLGEPGKRIDEDIQSLVGKGMDPHLQQAFDTVRVIGNEAVHPGELNLKDDRETAITLIDLINIVAQQMISNKKAIAALYARLPSDKLKGIEDRGKGASKKS